MPKPSGNAESQDISGFVSDYQPTQRISSSEAARDRGGVPVSYQSSCLPCFSVGGKPSLASESSSNRVLAGQALGPAPESNMDGYADHRVWDEEIRERVRIPVDEIDLADVLGSNPTGPTYQHPRSGQDSCLFWAVGLGKGRNFSASGFGF